MKWCIKCDCGPGARPYEMIEMVIWICSEPALDWNGNMNLLCTSAWLKWWYEFILANAWLKCVRCIADFLCHTELSAEAVWLFSGYRRELALFYEVFLFWFVVTTRVAMSQANLLMTWTWNVEQVNIGCRSFSWLLNIWIKCGNAFER